jgi:hypothetical protein
LRLANHDHDRIGALAVGLAFHLAQALVCHDQNSSRRLFRLASNSSAL